MKINTSKAKKEQKYRISNLIIISLVLIITFLISFFGGMAFDQNVGIRNFLSDGRMLLADSVNALIPDIRGEVGLYLPNGLDTVFIDIPFDSLLTIEEKRQEALVEGILITLDEDYVSASMHLRNSESINIKMRLKGDWVDHISGEKWSFRIHITDDDSSIFSMRRFSIQNPQTRLNEREWAYHQALLDEGILTTRFMFVNVVINGEYKGIYSLEESFTEDLLESQERRTGVIFRLNEDLLWKNRNNFGSFQIRELAEEIGYFWLTEYSEAEIKPFRYKRILGNIELNSEFQKGADLLNSFIMGDIPGEDVFDVDAWGLFFAITNFWGAEHSTWWHNLRFYYDPITGLIEPIGFDGNTSFYNKGTTPLGAGFVYKPFTLDIFNIPGVQIAFIESMERITSNQYLESYRNDHEEEIDYYYGALNGFFEYGIFHQRIPPLWDDFYSHTKILTDNLTNNQLLKLNVTTLQKEGKPYLELVFTNLMAVAVEINQIKIEGTPIGLDRSYCITVDCNEKLLIVEDELILIGREQVSFLLPIEDLEYLLLDENEMIIDAKIYGGSYPQQFQVHFQHEIGLVD